jgi:fucose permease
VLVAFASMHLRDHLGAGVGPRSGVLIAFLAGMAVGLLVTDRLLTLGQPIRLLRLAGALSGAAFFAWVFAPGLVASAALAALVGLCAAPLYPIAQAQAYRALPGRSGMVNAALSLLVPVELAIPLLLGQIADRLGLTAAMSTLALFPLGLAAIGVLASATRPRRSKV